MNLGRITGQVRIVGAGLLGASIGHGLRAKGVDVILHDASRSNATLAIDYGAGRAPHEDDKPTLVIVAVPPDVTAEVVARELLAWPQATVTDVASVAVSVLDELIALGVDLDRFIGSHPLAGRERGGAISARADLFIGRPWVIGRGTPFRRRAVEDLVIELGAVPVLMSASEHDDAVALVSHVPQVVSSLLAHRLADATDAAVGLAGQGLRDTTRIASSAPELWVQILSANAGPVAAILREFQTELGVAIDALENPDVPGSRRALAEVLAGGNAGVARIPGKHGTSKHFSQLVVMVDDKPGELARLLTEIGEANVNMEDLRLEHSPGAQFGLAEISVLPEKEALLISELDARGWKIAGTSA
ncbi:prephenate dehydrogenase [Salinibacterium sp. PAMC 21357]|uniref:prephenate dehydrogenase n=1 Tax=Salinibacterium sp. PAMC 21357 TaxID=1112215 RepID=UPI00028A36D2|nr:prephenate dehydrogenase [Salinibacterium sp. PAMC 21357]